MFDYNRELREEKEPLSSEDNHSNHRHPLKEPPLVGSEFSTSGKAGKDPPTGGIRNKFLGFIREYGKVGIAVYFSVSSITFALCYVGVKTGVDLKILAERLNLTIPSWSDKAGAFVITYATYKLLLPLRLALTAGITPWVKRRFNV